MRLSGWHVHSLASHLHNTRITPSSWKRGRQRLTDCKSTAMQQKGLREAASFAFYSFSLREPSVCTTTTFPYPSKKLSNPCFPDMCWQEGSSY